ncbi:hypothetical protein CPSG_10202 [Coccidioides posadasii str. Silveira]|uniref:Uncharacterized protein n=1 Tax=Coccidioides posadasii (strain RMSCC 757 / Silveira) TaxID=443226 RepID=E9DK53_COCPS|nr:hypothetical protein CPSG_10202 [Coccidioides posadasii str. Silveira]
MPCPAKPRAPAMNCSTNPLTPHILPFHLPLAQGLVLVSLDTQSVRPPRIISGGNSSTAMSGTRVRLGRYMKNSGRRSAGLGGEGWPTWSEDTIMGSTGRCVS